jgi:parvulin-like peptidyl-prolyl isomerase
MLSPAAQPPQVPPDRVIVTVGDVKITAADFDRLTESLQPQARAAARGPQRKQFADWVAQVLTLSQEAHRRKLDESADFKLRAMFQDATLLANALAAQLIKDVQVPEADERQYYESHKSEFWQVHARHILIRFQGAGGAAKPGQKELTDAEALAKAQDLRQKIQGGADFAELAKAESDDTGSGANGGDLGQFHHGQMVAPFEEAALKLKPGEISEPVKSQFGYHIIRVESHDTRSFEEVRPELEARLKPQQNQKVYTQAIDDLQKANPPVFDPEYFSLDKK